MNKTTIHIPKSSNCYAALQEAIDCGSVSTEHQSKGMVLHISFVGVKLHQIEQISRKYNPRKLNVTDSIKIEESNEAL